MSEPLASIGFVPEREAPRDVARDTRRDTGALARLAALHDETVETAHLANLLGRTPWLAATLALGAVATYGWVTGFGFEPAPAVWAVFVTGAAIALVMFYRLAVRSPFDLTVLRLFRGDAAAGLLYAGCAWGAGVFFLGPEYNLLTVMVFSVGMSALVEAVLRADPAARYFTVPAVMVPALYLAIMPFELGPAALLVVAGAALIAAAEAARRIAHPRPPALLPIS